MSHCMSAQSFHENLVGSIPACLIDHYFHDQSIFRVNPSNQFDTATVKKSFQNR
jgi:hypothetical protein